MLRLAVGVTAIDMLALLAVVNASLIATPTELLHLIIYIPRVEALRTSTLGWGNATPTELPRVRTLHNGLTIHGRWVHSIHIGRYYPHTCCIVFGTGEEDLGKPPCTFPIHRDDGNNL